MLISALVAVSALSGCGGDPAPGLAESRESVRSSVRDVAASLDDGPGEVVGATGGWSVCSAGSSDRLEYAAGLGLRADGDPVGLVRAVGERLVAAGWEVTDEGDTSVNLERDELRASARPSRTDLGQVTVEVSGGCVDGSREDVSDLEPEPIEVG